MWGFESLRPHHSAMQAGIMGSSAALGGVRYEILSKDKTKAMKTVETLNEGLKREYRVTRSEEHTSELQSLMRSSYAVFCLTNKTTKIIRNRTSITLYNTYK